MAGLVKAKKYDWKDSNLALFGTDVERGVSKTRWLVPYSIFLLIGKKSSSRNREGVDWSWEESRAPNMAHS